MNRELAKVLQSIINSSFEEKVELGKNALHSIADDFMKYHADDNKFVQFILNMTKLFAAADSSLCEGEYQMFLQVTTCEVSREYFVKLAQGGTDSAFVNYMLRIFAAMDNNLRSSVIIFGAALMSCDGELKDDELELVQKIFDLH